MNERRSKVRVTLVGSEDNTVIDMDMDASEFVFLMRLARESQRESPKFGPVINWEVLER